MCFLHSDLPLGDSRCDDAQFPTQQHKGNTGACSWACDGWCACEPTPEWTEINEQ
jgi:hypothetical protein